MKVYIAIIILLGFNKAAHPQDFPTKSCYQETSLSEEKIFDRMDIYPNYKGYVDRLNQFLIQYVDVDRIITSLSINTRFLSDTLEVNFVVSKAKEMSNLSVISIKNRILQEEVRLALIKSSCGWEPGSSSGRYLNGWFRNKFVFTLDRQGDYLSMKAEWLEPFAK